MRRAGFGATPDELDDLTSQGYEATVEQLLHPEEQPEIDELELFRYHPVAELTESLPQAQVVVLYRMVMTQQPLREKLALFWHHVFATGEAKVMGPYDLLQQIEIFRNRGLGNFKELLTEVSHDPAMLFWLDNNENHKRAVNENWARELLELFSMGVGSYSEDDVKEASRAFTGWSVGGKLPPIAHYGPFKWEFVYKPEDHDVHEKSFLGHEGRLNGEDVVEIIVQQPACALFVARHLYNFFVADEPQVPAWPFEAPGNAEAVAAIAREFVRSDLDLRQTLRFLFNSDSFKEAAYRKVKNPAEVVAGTLRLTGQFEGPNPWWNPVSIAPTAMGQSLLDPPSVEGWHTGREWINSGAFMNRVNFVADRLNDPALPGVRSIVERVAGSNGSVMAADELVDRCLEQVGPLTLGRESRDELVAQVAEGGPVSFQEDYSAASRRVCAVLSLIAGTREYQFG